MITNFMRALRILPIIMSMLISSVAQGQHVSDIPPTVQGNALPTCTTAREGLRMRVSATTPSNCNAAGSTVHMCECVGTSWIDGDTRTDAEVNALTAPADKIVLCGQLIDAGDSQTWVGPSVTAYLGGGGEQAIGGTACDALDSETNSAAADEVIDAGFPAFQVTGMQCIVSTDVTNDVAIVLHSAAATLTPTITCTIAGSGSGTGCSTTTSTTTDIAAGATISAEINYDEDLDTRDIWCQVYFTIQ